MIIISKQLETNGKNNMVKLCLILFLLLLWTFECCLVRKAFDLNLSVLEEKQQKLMFYPNADKIGM